MNYYSNKLRLRWQDMIQRCKNPNHHAFKYYGGRGIKVCERWQDFRNFEADLKKTFDESVKLLGLRQTTLDRKNNNKGYNPKNCRWATMKEQAKNRRKPEFRINKG